MGKAKRTGTGLEGDNGAACLGWQSLPVWLSPDHTARFPGCVWSKVTIYALRRSRHHWSKVTIVYIFPERDRVTFSRTANARALCQRVCGTVESWSVAGEYTTSPGNYRRRSLPALRQAGGLLCPPCRMAG